MATSLLAMNAVFGRFFDVLPVEAADPAAFKERKGASLLHLRRAAPLRRAPAYDPHNAEASRKGAVSKQGAARAAQRSARRLNPKLASDRGTLADLSWENFVKEVFLDSETAIGLISTPPGPYPQEAVVPPKEMTHIRDEINRITQSRRMLAHGLVTPQLGQADLDFMDQQAAHAQGRRLEGVHRAPPPKGFDRGWFVDDEKIAYPMLERARKLGVRRVCVHKGLPLGPVADYNHPRDLIKAAKDFPDIDFLVVPRGRSSRVSATPGAVRTSVPWTTEFCQMMKQEPGIKNVYMELGSTFGMTVAIQPLLTGPHIIWGRTLDAFGEDHILWGTDSIWWGTPQWQIEALQPLQDAEGAGGEARLRAADARGEGADLRPERRARVRRRRRTPSATRSRRTT